MSNVAFIGLGNMGAPMASNLVKAGHNVTVFDLVEASVQALVSEGARGATSAASAVQNADVVVTMLPAAAHVKSLYLGDEGIIAASSENTLFIDSSTIDADTARLVGKAAMDAGRLFVDAPVSGGVAGAKAGTLTFIVGGSDDSYAKAKPVLADMGKNIFHAGEAGAGQVAKICNNMLLAILMAGTSEALQLAIDNGLDPKVISDIMLESSGCNWTLQKYNPCPDVMEGVPSSNDYQGGFMTKLMNKDLNLAMAAAALSESATPMAATAQNLYKFHQNNGNADKDFSSIFRFYDKSGL